MIAKAIMEQKKDFFKLYDITIVDVMVEMFFATIDPEAPEVAIVVEKFAENRKINFADGAASASFLSEWTELSTLCAGFIGSMTNDDAVYAEHAKKISEDLAAVAFAETEARGLCEMIIGSMDMIVFVYSRFFELQSMIRELFQYEIEETDEFTKIIENTCLTFSQECRHFDKEKVYDEFYGRVSALFHQVLILAGIALLSSNTREKETK